MRRNIQFDRLTYKAILVDMQGDFYRFRETLRTNGITAESLTPSNLEVSANMGILR